MNEIFFYDANGLKWIWDREEGRIFMETAEEEFDEVIDDYPENGYYADTLEECIKMLIEYGYMEMII